jgi:ABC-2 type transport system permease protein
MTANFGRYARFIARRERVISSIWLAVIVGFAAALTAAYPSLFPSKEALVNMSFALNTPSMVAMMGPVYGTEVISPAIAMAQECLMWFAIAMIVMNIYFINRHTRIDEELGRHEMLASLPMGRMTGSVAAITSVFALDIAVSLLCAFAIIAINIEGTTVGGAFCFAFSAGMQGFLFGALALLAAQLFSTALGVTGVSFGLMGLFYVLRAFGDISGNALSYISPMGLGLKVEAFYTDAPWPVIILFAEAVAVMLIALAVNARRDVGAGVIPARRGRSRASMLLRSPFGLAWRLTSKQFIVWAFASLLLGAAYGSVIGEVENYIGGNDTVLRMLKAQGGAGARQFAEAFIPYLSSIMAMLICVPVLNTVNRLRAEERRGRLEQIYAKSVSRGSLYFSFVVIAVAEAVVFSLLSAVGLYGASASTELFTADVFFKAAAVQIPAILVIAAADAALVGAAPALAPLIWVLFGYCFLMLYFANLFSLPQVAIKISPFGNIPNLSVEEFKAAPAAILSAIAVLFGVVGLLRYRERDIG